MPKPLESIDPTALGAVSGGAARATASGGGGDSEISAALTGILDSIKSLAGQSQGGLGPTEMMMFAMMLGRRNSAPQVASSGNPYAGYTIDGVFYPFPR